VRTVPIVLDRWYIYRGTFYGPGLQDVPEEMADRHGLSPETADAAAGNELTTEPAVAAETVTATPLPEDTPHRAYLLAGGVATVEGVFSHPDLTELRGIGAGRAKQILDYLLE
jgi:predicted flap endonuclease-1-like 5' DNA nuclease